MGGVNSSRIMARLEELSQIGRTPSGGVTRLGLTPEEWAAKTAVARWMEEAGLRARFDAAANLIGCLDGVGDPVVLGSHLDSVIEGGRFDGVLGVLVALEVAQQEAPSRDTSGRPLEVIAFTDEEGTRFGSGFSGSRAMLGVLPAGVLDRRDTAGIAFGQALQAQGFPPERIGDAARDPRRIHAYLEVHIEQGAVLGRLGLPVGVVTGIAGPVHWRVTLTGRAGHAGATPMNMRQDPLMAAARVFAAVEDAARDVSPTAVATVGKVRVEPGAVNVIPRLVEFSLDVRDIDRDSRDRLIDSVRGALEETCRARGVECEVQEQLNVDPVPLSPRTQDLLADACAAAGAPVHRMPSGAGHDAMVFAPVVETGLLFVRSRGGLSHCPEEWTDEADIRTAAEVLAEAVNVLRREVG